MLKSNFHHKKKLPPPQVTANIAKAAAEMKEIYP